MSTPQPNAADDSLPALPLPSELRALIISQTTALTALEHHHALLASLASIIQAQVSGNPQMNVQVALGEGYSIEGVVPETECVYVNLGWEDVWLEMELAKAEEFVGKKVELLEAKIAALEEPIVKLRKDYALVAETLRNVLQAPPEGHLNET